MQSISSITITPSGNIYIATGGISFESTLNYEGSGSQSGDGIWYSDDDGLTFQQLSGTNICWCLLIYDPDIRIYQNKKINFT